MLSRTSPDPLAARNVEGTLSKLHGEGRHERCVQLCSTNLDTVDTTSRRVVWQPYRYRFTGLLKGTSKVENGRVAMLRLSLKTCPHYFRHRPRKLRRQKAHGRRS